MGLIETKQSILALIREAEEIVHQCGKTLDDMDDYLSEFLTAKGVIVPPCKVGDTVWVCNQTAGKVFKNTVIGLYVCGKSKFKNSIKCEYRNILGEISHRKFTFAQVGKNIFFTREEAEAALKGGEKNDK